AYLPLDPAYPEERLAFMQTDSGAPITITRAFLDAAGDAPSTPPPCLTEPHHVAYVLYTSGSTGKPKGVLLPQQALVNLLLSARERVEFAAGETMLALTTLSFDIASMEMLLPLCCGGRVLIATREVAMDGRALIQLVAHEEVDVVQATPATWRLAAAAGWNSEGLRMITGGEPMPRELAERLLQGGGRLFNMYGPTETTIYSTFHEVHTGQGPVPIGKPLHNTRIYLLDGLRQLVPQGVPGEICIAGDGVARGYLNRPELTEEKFVPDPFGPGRLYRTGDLGRYLENGEIEILGRIDHQVKVNGIRMEPGEIECALTAHDEVRQALVMVREDAPGDKRLVAYCVARPEKVGAAELRSWLQARLPAFMVPSAFVVLAEFPLTPNGKVNRHALPAPEGRREQPQVEAMPGDLLEYQLTRLFEDVLNVHPVGIHDSFFDLGGTSILGVKLLTRLERMLNQKLPLMAIYDAPSVSQMAQAMRQRGASLQLSCLVPLRPQGELPPFFCVHALIGDVCRDLARHVGPDQPFYGLQPRGLDGTQAAHFRIEEMARYYLQEVRNVQPQGPYYLGGYCFGGVVAYEMAQQLTAAGERVGMVCVIDVPPPNVPRRSLPARLRGLLNNALWAGNRLRDACREPHSLGRKLRYHLKRWRGAVSLEDVHPLLETMNGMSRWPEHYQRIAQINYQAFVNYRPRPYSGRLTLIRRDEPFQPWGVDDPAAEWGELAGAVEVHRVSGHHDQIMNEPHVQEVGAVLRRSLDAARRDLGGCS
ncbi:MAG: amino acid adenylation domain-containing protein, partial [Candidatus Xenobia bacterium]